MPLKRLRPALAALLLAAAVLPARAQGSTLVVGGALRDDNAEVWGRLVQLAGGPGACVAVFTAASGSPDAAAAAIATSLARHGARAEHVRVGPLIAGSDVDKDVRDPAWIAVVKGCKAVFFSGGAQARLMDLLQPAGRGTPLLDAVRELWRAGGVVAGSSAGTAVMSEVAFRDAPDPLAVMKGRLREGREWDRGFGFLPPQVVVDQHAVRRGRLARLLPLLQAQGRALGVAVEEDSAALFKDGRIEVLGSAGVLIADLSRATRDARLPAFNLAGGTLHWLESGDRYELASGRVEPAPAKRAGQSLQPLSPTHRGYHEGPAFHADLLGEGVIVQALSRLVDSDQRESRGLAFAARPLADDPAPELGFEWRFWVDEGTRGWLRLQPAAYTLQGVRLDIVPVRMQRPLYTPVGPQ
jgi:cyanophycinase